MDGPHQLINISFLSYLGSCDDASVEHRSSVTCYDRFTFNNFLAPSFVEGSKLLQKSVDDECNDEIVDYNHSDDVKRKKKYPYPSRLSCCFIADLLVIKIGGLHSN